MNIDCTILDNSEIPRQTKYFLQALASFSDAQGKCWPSEERIGKRMGVSSRSVRKYLRQAVELQLVKVKRRWRKSNVYRLLCLAGRGLSTMRNQRSEENRSNINKNGFKIKTPCKIPKVEWKLCFEDARQVLGEKVTKKNRGWLTILIRKAGADLFLDGLRWVRSQMLQGEAEGKPVHAPGGLLTWLLRKQGVEV